MKLEVGKKYRTRDGLRVFGPVEPDPHPALEYQFIASGGDRRYFYTVDGFVIPGRTNDCDLVEEVTDDRVDNSGSAVVPGHDPEAGHSYHDGTGSECLEVPPLEWNSNGVRAWVVSRLAAVSRVVRRLCGVPTVRDRDDHDLSSR